MLSSIQKYPTTFFSPTYPLGAKVSEKTEKSQVSFAGGLPKYQPEVFAKQSHLKEESFKCGEPSDPTIGQRVNLKA